MQILGTIVERYLSYKRRCPKCDSDKVVPIIYGMPGLDLVEKENRGELCQIKMEIILKRK